MILLIYSSLIKCLYNFYGTDGFYDSTSVSKFESVRKIIDLLAKKDAENLQRITRLVGNANPVTKCSCLIVVAPISGRSSCRSAGTHCDHFALSRVTADLRLEKRAASCPVCAKAVTAYVFLRPPGHVDLPAPRND